MEGGNTTMEFMSRGRGQTPAPQTATNAGSHVPGEPTTTRGKKRGESAWSKYLFLRF